MIYDIWKVKEEITCPQRIWWIGRGNADIEEATPSIWLPHGHKSLWFYLNERNMGHKPHCYIISFADLVW